MRSRSYSLVVAGLVAVAGAIAVGGGDAAVKKCKPTQVALTVAGKRTCVPRATFRPTAAPVSEAAAFVRDALSRPTSVTRKRDKRRVVLRPAPAALTRLATAKTAELEAAARVAVQAALTAKTNARARTHGAPGVTITNNANGSVTGSATESFSSGGNTASITLEVTGRIADGAVAIDFGVGVTTQSAEGLITTVGVTAKDFTSSSTASCPTADGAIRLDDKWDVTVRKSDTARQGNTTLGTVRTGGASKGKVTATARMSPDAKLTPFPFAITQTLDVAVSTQILGFVSTQTRTVATGSLSGTIDPSSGQIAGGAAKVNVVFTGPGDAASVVRAKVSARIEMEKSLRETAGRLLKSAQAVEKRARDGECTKIVFNPTTPGDLPPNGNVNVGSRLETKAGEKVPQVKWTASAAKGSVSPASSPNAEPSWSVTGAAEGPETANIPVRAVSAAGISEVPWIGGQAFPRTYSGSASLRFAAGSSVDNWAGNFTWVRSSIQQNPDKSQLARYTLTSGTVNSYTHETTVATGVCRGQAAGSSGNVVFGDLEIFVDAAGAWRSAFVVDIDVADFPVTCPPPLPEIILPAKSVLNSRQSPGFVLRPMTAGGPIAATNVTDVGIVNPAISSIASWSLQPGS